MSFLLLKSRAYFDQCEESRKCEGSEGEKSGGGARDERRKKRKIGFLSPFLPSLLSRSSSAFLSLTSFAFSALLRIDQSIRGSSEARKTTVSRNSENIKNNNIEKY